MHEIVEAHLLNMFVTHLILIQIIFCKNDYRNFSVQTFGNALNDLELSFTRKATSSC